jgi:hypothetical protein
MPAVDADAAYLEKLGYKQELKRSLGPVHYACRRPGFFRTRFLLVVRGRWRRSGIHRGSGRC